MNVIKTVLNAFSYALLGSMLTLIALFVYAMYTSDGALMNDISCQLHFDKRLDETVCMNTINN